MRTKTDIQREIEETESELNLLFQGLVSGAFGKLDGEGNTSDEINPIISELTTKLAKLTMEIR